MNRPEVKCKHINHGKFQIIEYYNLFEANVMYLAKNGHMDMSESLTQVQLLTLACNMSCFAKYLANLNWHELLFLFFKKWITL